MKLTLFLLGLTYLFLIIANHYTITIPCKYYIKVYLENNCGAPVDLSCFPEFYYVFKSLLTKKGEPFKLLSKPYEPETVTIIIPDDWFYRHGYLMNKSSIFKFNQLIEKQLKYKMRQYIGMNSAYSRTVASYIKDFQEKYGFSESDWNFESIKKDFYRHGDKIKTKNHLSAKEGIDNIIYENFSKLGMKHKKNNSHNYYERG